MYVMLSSLSSASLLEDSSIARLPLVNSIVATLIVIYQWTVVNCAGQTKRAIASALVAGSFSVGNIIGPQTFQAKDAPLYVPAKVTVMATQGGAAVVTTLLFLYYFAANKRKDSRQVVVESDSEQNEIRKWVNQMDKENKSFRHVY